MTKEGLIQENRKFSSGGVGVFNGDVAVHMFPSVRLVPGGKFRTGLNGTGSRKFTR